MKKKLSNPNEEKKGISDRVIFRLFEDNNLSSQVNTFIILLAFSIMVDIAFTYQNFWKKPDNLLDLETIVFTIVFFGIIVFFAKFAERKCNVAWLYPIITIYLLNFLYVIYDFNASLMEPFYVLKNWLSSRGGAAYLVIAPLAAWNLFLGSIVEAILLLRIFTNIRSQK